MPEVPLTPAQVNKFILIASFTLRTQQSLRHADFGMPGEFLDFALQLTSAVEVPR